MYGRHTQIQSENCAYSKIFRSVFDLKWQNVSKIVTLVKGARKILELNQLLKIQKVAQKLLPESVNAYLPY